jgi:acyl-CoA reductase-like NAD-dependent aldehyde dehydrogenase
MGARALSPSWTARAAARRVDPRPFINGVARETAAKSTLVVRNPATLAPQYEIADSGIEDISAAVDSARAAFDDGRWSRLAPAARRTLLLNFAALVEANADELALDDTLDMGKPISNSIAEAPIAAGFLRFNAEAIDKLTGAVTATPEDCVELQVHEPRGVVAVIVPWNFPTINAALKLGPALAVGNTVVLKPSELAPASSLRLARLAREAGIPDGVLNVVPGGRAAGRELVTHRGTDMVAFTGSTPTGKAILRDIGSSQIKPVLLECGGKSPQLVFDDAREFGIDDIARALVHDALWNSGQVCVARTRVLLQSGIYPTLVQALIKELEAVRFGDPLDVGTTLGPLAGTQQQGRVEEYVAAARRAGANQALRLAANVIPASGCYVAPALLTDVDASAQIVQEEVFGPVLTVQKFDTEEEAVALANSTVYGLAATVWTPQLARALRLARRVRAGTVQVAGSTAASAGGGFAYSSEPMGQSGFGAEGGMPGLRNYMTLKTIRLIGRLG